MQYYFNPKQRKQHTRRLYLHPSLPEIGIYYPETDEFLCQPYWVVAFLITLMGVGVYGTYLAASAAGYLIIWAAAVLFAASYGYMSLFPPVPPSDPEEKIENAVDRNLLAAPLYLLMEYTRASSFTVWTPPASVGQPADIGLQMTAFMTWSPVAWWLVFMFAATAWGYGMYVVRKSLWSA